MRLRLDVLSAFDCEQVRKWRSLVPETLRTPYGLTVEMQEHFYETVVCNRQGPHRYWAVRPAALDGPTICLGMAGLTYIQWENGLAEISLILDPDEAGKGYGRDAVALILREGFDRMRLLAIFGEAYESNPALAFWLKMVTEFSGTSTRIPCRKWWNGRAWGSCHFTFTAEAWRQGEV